MRTLLHRFDVSGLPAYCLQLIESASTQASSNLGRWLDATSSPELSLQRACESGERLRLFLRIIGASQPIADILIQNPELANLVFEFDPAEFPEVDKIVAEGRRLLVAATSPSHALDRIRFLKQRWQIPLVVADVAGSWQPERVWQAISNLAEAIITLTAETVWTHFAAEKGIELTHPPLAIAAFGKLGGGELNYSSDVDLVFIAEEGVEERVKPLLARYAETLSRALSDRSGRGHLYRVDFRLRPYGSTGPLVPPFGAVASYYELYAEPWEMQALLRSRVIYQPPGSARAQDWDELVQKTCFKPKISDFTLDSLFSMRDRIEEFSTEDDLKRGRGGIRDVEFLVQILQLVHGFASPQIRTRPTLEALAALAEASHLSQADAGQLAQSYTFLRQLEHRCQLVADQQTHKLPASDEAREAVAGLMNCENSEELTKVLDDNRAKVAAIYDRFVSAGHNPSDPRRQIADALDAELLHWIDGLPESDALFQALSESESGRDRLLKLNRIGPALLNRAQNDLGLVELLISGEIEEPSLGSPKMNGASEATRLAINWCLTSTVENGQDLGQDLTALVERVLKGLVQELAPKLNVLALGSFARGDMTLASDADVILLAPSQEEQPEAEKAAQEILREATRLHGLGAPLKLDLRLRPDGGKGLLVRSFDAFRAYEKDGMDLWERFALGQARLIHGEPEALAVVETAAYALPLNQERLTELLSMKQRIESERLKPRYVWRNVKLGHGGLGDIEWLVHLHEMRMPPTLLGSSHGRPTSLKDRIHRLHREGQFNAAEELELYQGLVHLTRLRHLLIFQGLADDTMPENPDKLDRLATAFGSVDGNALLMEHQAVTARLREIYEEGISRLCR